MIYSNPNKSDFDFSGKISVDTQNQGFNADEIGKITDGIQTDGSRGAFDWIGKLWEKNRSTPPEIQNLKSNFGYQTELYLVDLIELAKVQGTPLDAQLKVLSAKYNFFVMPCGVYISPEEGEEFEALKFEVDFKHDRVSTYSMFPEPESKKIFEVGGKIDMGITGKAEFGLPQIPINLALVEAAAKVELETKFIFSFHYEFKTQVIDGYGPNTNFCRWIMYRGKDLRNNVTFYPVVRAPKSVNEFDCEFKAFFKIGHDDWKQSEFFLKPKKLIRVAC